MATAEQDCDELLEVLIRVIVLAWHPRMLEVFGQPTKKCRVFLRTRSQAGEGRGDVGVAKLG